MSLRPAPPGSAPGAGGARAERGAHPPAPPTGKTPLRWPPVSAPGQPAREELPSAGHLGAAAPRRAP
eukprot:4068906-Alexandrium_andersonii.AAC.1